MGRLTVTQIVSEGQLLAQRDDMATEATGWLQRWLDAVAASWPWPNLHEESRDVPLAAGTSLLAFGNGASGGPSYMVQKILDNVWLYTADKTFRKRIRIRHWLSNPVDRIQPTTSIGAPDTARVFSSYTTGGRWSLSFEPVPDKDYLLTIPHLVLPPVYTGSDIPWYPNDETMVQAVAFKVAEYHHGKDSPITSGFQQMLAGLIANDRIRYGAVKGINDVLPLDPTVFRPRS